MIVRQQSALAGLCTRGRSPRTAHSIDTWKVLVPKRYGHACETIPHQILGKPLSLSPAPSALRPTSSLGPFDPKREAESLAVYYRTGLSASSSRCAKSPSTRLASDCTPGFPCRHGTGHGQTRSSTRSTASPRTRLPSSISMIRPMDAATKVTMSKTIEEILAPKPEAGRASTPTRSTTRRTGSPQGRPDHARREAARRRAAQDRRHQELHDRTGRVRRARRRHDLHATTRCARRSSGKASRTLELEWMRCTVKDVKTVLTELRTGQRFTGTHHETFPMRREQAEAVKKTHAYFLSHLGGGHARRPALPLEREDALRQDLHHLPARQEARRQARAGGDLQARGGGCVADGP